MTLLELREVSKTYRQGGLWTRKKSMPALCGVSLKLAQGKCLAVVGPSGSGKSTLGRLVLGLEEPDCGSVLYKGKPYSALKQEERRAARRNVQVVFQNSHWAVNPRFTALEIVGEPLRNFDRLRGAALENKVTDLLARVGLQKNMLKKLPHQCSGGELQRICLARALAPEPELIVLDEAVSSLDMLSQSLVLDLLAEIKAASNTAFLFISHDLRVVGKVADSLALVKNGRLAAYASDLNDPAQTAQIQKAPAFQELAEAILPATADVALNARKRTTTPRDVNR